MKNTTLRTLLIAFAAALALALAGCKGESSPTAPSTTTVVPGSPGITPPTGATITLTVSNANPLVSSKVTVTATVTANGQPVPDGTAVQFTTSLGTFADTGQNTTVIVRVIPLPPRNGSSQSGATGWRGQHVT